MPSFRRSYVSAIGSGSPLRRLGVLAVLVAGLVGCGGGEDDATGSAESEVAPKKVDGHQKMRAVLAQISARADEENRFVGDARARKLRNEIQQMSFGPNMYEAADHWEVRHESGRRELLLGNEVDSIERLKEALVHAEKVGKREVMLTHFELGLAYLRLGETQNCCLRHGAESCIVPIQGSGVHTKRLGSEKAREHFLAVLESNARAADEDEQLEVVESAKWLLNIAAMTLGEYPDGVPEEYRVSPDFFESEIDFPRFPNVYPKLGLNTFNLCGGAVVDDFDGDKYLDIITCTWDVSGQTQVFRNDGDGTFTEVTKEAGLEGFYGGLNLGQTDFDNDGDLDVYIMRGAWLKAEGLHPNSLLRNDGDLKFTDVTFEAGLANDFRPTKTAEWADYDLDGDLDLFVGNDSTGDVIAANQLFRNNGDGTFTDVAEQAGLQEALFSMGANWGDFDGDRYPDLYVSCYGPNRLYRNNRDGTFTNVAEDLGVTRPHSSFPAWFWDYDQDGHLDIFVGASSGPVGVLATEKRFELMHLYRNKGDGTFENVAPHVGLDYPAQPMGANFGDLDADGFPDFYLATGNTQYSELRPNVMFKNQAGENFVNVTMAGGFGHLQKGHGVSFADLDNDGDQDVYVQLGGAYPGDKFKDALFENPGFGHHTIALRVEGRRTNRCGIGARVRAVVTEDGKTRTIHHLVSTGSSFGANPLRYTLGLGSATKIDRLEVDWPVSDTTQVFENVPVDRMIRVIEGADEVEVIELQPSTLGGPKQDRTVATASTDGD